MESVAQLAERPLVKGEHVCGLEVSLVKPPVWRFSMLITLSFPLLDLRELYTGRMGKVRLPVWDSVRDRDFIRSFGQARPRPAGSAGPVLGEGTICEFKHFWSLNCHDNMVPTISRVYSRYIAQSLIDPGANESGADFFHGSLCVTGRIELGVILKKNILHDDEFNSFLSILSMSANFREIRNIKLISAGGHLARRFERNTYIVSGLDESAIPKNFVLVETPIVTVSGVAPSRFDSWKCQYHEKVRLESNQEGVGTKYGSISASGKRVPLCIIERPLEDSGRMARLIRIYLIRAYCEHSSLRTFVSRFSSGRIIEHSEDGQTLDITRVENYLMRAVRYIKGNKASEISEIHDALASISRRMLTNLTGNEVDGFISSLDEKLRRRNPKSVMKNYFMASYCNELYSVHRDSPNIMVVRGDVFVREIAGGLNMTNQDVKIAGSNYAPITAAGRNANVGVAGKDTAQIDLQAVVLELKELRNLVANNELMSAPDVKKINASIDLIEANAESDEPELSEAESCINTVVRITEKTGKFIAETAKVVVGLRTLFGIS